MLKFEIFEFQTTGYFFSFEMGMVFLLLLFSVSFAYNPHQALEYADKYWNGANHDCHSPSYLTCSPWAYFGEESCGYRFVIFPSSSLRFSAPLLARMVVTVQTLLVSVSLTEDIRLLLDTPIVEDIHVEKKNLVCIFRFSVSLLYFFVKARTI